MPEEILAVTSLKGTVQQCGAAYGELFAPRILGFCQQEVKPDPARLAYAARCWMHVERDAPLSSEFLKGMAAGARLPLEWVALLALHEEIGHMAHCTAFVAAGEATQGGLTINAQNWDFPALYYPWPGLLTLQASDSLDTLTYHLPGLWACAGINEAGLSLLWTTTAILPMVPPEVGIPTYILIAEALRRKTVEETVQYIRSVKCAGAFNFLLGDASGATAVVEALPGCLWVDRSSPALCRANHYLGEDAARLSQQDIRSSYVETHTTTYRIGRMAQLLRQYDGAITPAVARTILTDRDGPWPWVHQYPEGEEGRVAGVMTLDSLIAISQDRAFCTCRGGRTPGPWQESSL